MGPGWPEYSLVGNSEPSTEMENSIGNDQAASLRIMKGNKNSCFSKYYVKYARKQLPFQNYRLL